MMNSEYKEILIEYIKAGSRINGAFVEVRKLLESVDMKMYTQICCNRIKDAGLIDDIHIKRGTDFPRNLSMDVFGIMESQDILKGYVEPDLLSDIIKGVQGCEDVSVSMNNTLYILRHHNRAGLRKMYREALEVKDAGSAQQDADLIAAELKCRNPFHKVKLALCQVSTICSVIAEVRLPIRIIPLFLKKVFPLSKNDVYQPRYKGGPYHNALTRFKTRNQKSFKKLNHKNLIRYVFLGVRAYGKEYLKNHRLSEPALFDEMEWIYQECHQIMAAIGSLTSRELMQMFPVTKRYDGEKDGCKDYFWTMKKLEEFETDKPIGTEQDAADILWDYVNTDLDFFIMNWLRSVEDLSTYCNRGEPFEQFYVNRKKRKNKRAWE